MPFLNTYTGQLGLLQCFVCNTKNVLTYVSYAILDAEGAT